MYPNDQLPEQLDEYIRSGIQNAKRRKRNRNLRRGAGIACCLVLTLFLSAIRISPAFASYLSTIPGLEYVVDLVRLNKGLQSAVENEFIQNINVSDEHQGIQFTVKDIIADNTSMVIFYSIENKSGYEMPRLTDVAITDEADIKLKVFFDYGFGPYEESIYNGRLNISFPGEEDADFEIPDTILLTTKMQVGDPDILRDNCPVLDDTWKVSVPIEKSKFENMERQYAIDRTVEIAGQKIHFERAVIYPTRVSVDFTFDDNNTMEIFALEDLALVDENGNEWGTIRDGLTLSHISDTKKRIFFQSNYFTMPKKLSIKGSGIRALDKDKAEVVIDPDHKTILKAPDEKVQLKELKLGETSLSMVMQLEKAPNQVNQTYEFLSWAGKDNSNQELNRKRDERGSSDNWTYIEYDYEYTFESPLQGPVSFEISDYPNLIRKDFEIRILPEQ